MISVIVCSRKSEILDDLKMSITSTISCDHEIIIIDNSNNLYSIFTAYNEGVSRAKGNILCFCHEDVLFRTANWGKIIEQHFMDDDQIGLIGFAGSHFLADTPMYWYSSPFVSQRNLNNDNGRVEEHFHEDWFGDRSIIEVVAVDGFCFFVKKSLFDRISFDEKTYKGFHLYDMDICMQVLQTGHKVCVVRDVLAEHCWSEAQQFTKQGGNLFEHNLELFSEKWRTSLPACKGITLPNEVLSRVNELFRQSYSARQVRQSKAYHLGKALLAPVKWIKK